MPARDTHHGEEHREGYLRVLHCDGFLAGIHDRLENGYKKLHFCGRF